MRSGKWRAEAVSTTCDTVDRESWKEARDEIAHAVADAALNEADKTGVALARNENGGPIFATMGAMHKSDGTYISFEEQERAEAEAAEITHHQVTLFTAEAHELSRTDKTEEEDFAEQATRIEPSFANRYAARPNSVSLAMRIASASSVNRISGAIGPNVSSRQITMSAITSVSTVGRKKLPPRS